MYAEVVFNIPIEASFFYAVPDSLTEKQVGQKISPGIRVSAPLGSRKMTGFVTGLFSEKPEVDFEIREIERIIDSEPLFGREYYDLAKWVSSMYMCSPGEALFSMIPSGRREKEFDTDIDLDDREKRGKITLNRGQEEAVRKISESCGSLFYLYGVTGSGKTEVYFRIAEEAVKNGGSVIYLVPEIALTHQLTEYVTERFGKNLAVIHSALTPSQKLKQWRKIQREEAKVILGARSAVFAPVKNPALIIIDEEHEASYKSGSTPRYHARQVAMHRIKLSGGKLIMGSATPSVEACHLMNRGKIEKIELKEVAAGGSFAPVKIVDMNSETSAISSYLQQQIRETASEKGQSILFLNRRGFFYYFHCLHCGHEEKCSQCSVPLTYHMERGRLVCHYCGYSRAQPRVCPSCGSVEVGYSGFGTEKVESDIKKLFPYLSVERLDRDSVKKGGGIRDVLARFRDGKIDILLGTQMIAKGLNFPGVKLIGIILADTTLQLPDYRAEERTYSLITQVSGRTGRFSAGGKVVIQTYRPWNHAVRCAAERKPEEFYAREIENRKAMGFPHFSRMIRVVFRSKERKKSGDFALKFSEHLKEAAASFPENSTGFTVLGPAECPLSLISGNYRYHLLVLSENFRLLHSVVKNTASAVKPPGGVYTEIDVDPVALM